MTKVTGIVGAVGIAFWLAMNGWKFYKAGGIRKVADFAGRVNLRITKARKALKAKL